MSIKYCSIDLELEQPKTNHQTTDSLLDVEKIIQVGYVIYELEPEFKVLKKVCEHINIGVPLSAFIKKLTGISDEDVASGKTIEEVFDILVEDKKQFDFSAGVIQWGGGDMECLQKEIQGKRKWSFGRSGVNVKHMYQMYAEANGMKKQGGLSKSMAKMGIKWTEGAKHNALSDAYHTALVHDFMYRKLKWRKKDEGSETGKTSETV